MPTRMLMRYTKWESLPHWEFEATSLGEDHHGLWLGIPAGTQMTRPGVDVRVSNAHVLLVPDAPFTAMFCRKQPTEADPDPVAVYVDITTVPVRGAGVVSAVDLDLDILRSHSSRVWLEDEDEFARHQLDLGYPAEIVDLAATTASRLLADVAQGAEPFGLAATLWLDLMQD